MTTDKTNIEQENFGQLQGKEVKIFTLTNTNGMKVKITEYGATITSITLPVEGKEMEIACGFDTLEGYFGEEYKANAPYFGCTVGRYCSQIKDAKFSLNGKDYQLAEMVGKNNLHGGLKGFDKQVWSSEIKGNTLVFSLTSPDGQEGFPGTVEAQVSFMLTSENEIKIEYLATTDADTPLSMTNHTYWNLSGFEEKVLGHTATVYTDKKIDCDETGAGTGVISVAGAVDDLREGKVIGDVHEAMGGGFEHFYVFDNAAEELKPYAAVENKAKGIKLEVSSTEPSMLLYTGKYTSDDLKRENGLQYGQYKGFCCETHRWPNGPNIEGSPKSITKAGEEFKSTTVFKLEF
ncbi:aldose epimerase family protein [Reichenbachiella versicolor]|uniref:aldose epimerase family protein n=1 Tax=Reichenbachiella versicolor TaxID=1821036 RepID=UPI000D6E34B5|nr:aldose epimerase family protein [Reichenbachiella versicolor]